MIPMHFISPTNTKLLLAWGHFFDNSIKASGSGLRHHRVREMAQWSHTIELEAQLRERGVISLFILIVHEYVFLLWLNMEEIQQCWEEERRLLLRSWANERKQYRHEIKQLQAQLQLEREAYTRQLLKVAISIPQEDPVVGRCLSHEQFR